MTNDVQINLMTDREILIRLSATIEQHLQQDSIMQSRLLSLLEGNGQPGLLTRVGALEGTKKTSVVGGATGFITAIIALLIAKFTGT